MVWRSIECKEYVEARKLEQGENAVIKAAASSLFLPTSPIPSTSFAVAGISVLSYHGICLSYLLRIFSHSDSHTPSFYPHSAISIKASLYCKARPRKRPVQATLCDHHSHTRQKHNEHHHHPFPFKRNPEDRGSLSWYGKAINFNGLWKPNYLLHAPIPTQISTQTTLNDFTLLSIREPIASSSRECHREGS